MKKLSIILIAFFTSAIFAQVSNVVHPKWSNDSAIYEVNIRQYSEEGTINAFMEHLPRLKELGIEILWLMPIHPIGEINRKGTLGSYYSVKDYKGLNPEFGTKEDFQKLVDSIHALDMYVIIDWVANHTAWDNPWTKSHPEFFMKDTLGNFVTPNPDWTDVLDLNYKNNSLWYYMTDALKYWVEEFNIDGYRCDVAGMIPVEFWNQARKELDKIKPVFMLAEWDTPEMHYEAFDMTYDWTMHNIMNNIAKGEKDVNELKKHIIEDRERYPENAYRMQFTSNHDENSWNGTVFERLGDGAETFLVLSTLIPDMPLVYSGQEAGMNKRLSFFEKDLIEWKDHSFFELYKNLIQLKKENKALHNGNFGGEVHFAQNSEEEKIFSFVRKKSDDKIFAVFNLSDEKVDVTINDPVTAGIYYEFFSKEPLSIDSRIFFDLKPWEYKIYIHEDLVK